MEKIFGGFAPYKKCMKNCILQAMGKARQDHNTGPSSPAIIPEYRMWEDHWIRWANFR